VILPQPAKLIRQFITENGLKPPTYVFNLLLDTYDTLISDKTHEALQEAIATGTFTL
jgi:hypothetical protein